MKHHEQSVRAENIAAISNYYRAGIKSKASKIGIEIEHTLVYPDGSQVAYDSECGTKGLLEKLSASFPEPIIENDNIIGRAGKNKTVTLEPAAQVELSAGPFESLVEAKTCIDAFENKLLNAGENCGIEVLTPGYHPTMRAADLKMIPKQRYAIMNKYLGDISMFGVYMMRGSASTQISIDYTSEQDCIRKLRLSNACVPIFSLICDNSPVFEGEPRKHNMVRTKIWEMCDPDRCGTVPEVMDADFSLETYAAYILDTPALVAKVDGVDKPCKETFGELFADKVMSTDDIEHALSMFFNDVRLKQYIEIRPADAMPSEYVVAYAALIKGLFYNEESLSKMDALFKNVSAEDITLAKTVLMQKGYTAEVYRKPVSEIADELVNIAVNGLSQEEKYLLDPIAKLVAQRTTLADISEKK